MNKTKKLQKKISSRQNGFTLNEAMVTVFIFGILALLIMGIMKSQASLKKVADLKTTMNLIHNAAQQAVRKFEISDDLDHTIKTSNVLGYPELRDCFNGVGSNCDTGVKPGFTGFTVVSPGDKWDQINHLMNGSFTLDGSSKLPDGTACTFATCPVTSLTTWNFECESFSCRSIKFRVNVSLNPALVKSPEMKAMSAGIPALTAESEYSRTKQVGLLRNIASSCAQGVVPTGTNFDSGTTACAQETVDSTNKLFDSNMGFDFENADLRLIAGSTTGGTTTSGTTGSTDNCPPGTVAKMTDAGVVCTEPPLLCSNEGWIVSNGKCCKPTIPNGGDGWDQFGSCSAQCSPTVGKHTRSCLYPKEDYCSSVCSRGATDTEDCSGKPTAPDLTGLGKGWSNWGACTRACGGGTQVTSCTLGTDKGYCADCSASDPAKTQACNTQACCTNAGYRNGQYCSKKGHDGYAGFTCPAGQHPVGCSWGGDRGAWSSRGQNANSCFGMWHQDASHHGSGCDTGIVAGQCVCN